MKPTGLALILLRLLLLFQADATGYLDLIEVTSAAAIVTVAEAMTANVNNLCRKYCRNLLYVWCNRRSRK